MTSVSEKMIQHELRQARHKVEFLTVLNDSLRLRCEASEQGRVRDNEYLIGQREELLAAIDFAYSALTRESDLGPEVTEDAVDAARETLGGASTAIRMASNGAGAITP